MMKIAKNITIAAGHQDVALEQGAEMNKEPNGSAPVERDVRFRGV
jgi:hypothetical protein